MASLTIARSAVLGLLLVRSGMADLTISLCLYSANSKVGAVILNCIHPKALQTWEKQCESPVAVSR